MMHPVSVLIPAYNADPRWLAETITSATRALAAEIVVIDDGSAHPLLSMPWPTVRAYRQEHAGIAAALNHARRRASQPWVSPLSVGDVVYPAKFAACLTVERPAVFHDYVDRVTGRLRVTAGDWRSRIWSDNQFCAGMALLSAQAWDAAAGVDESLQWCVDWDFACRVEQSTGWHYLDEILGGAAEHPGGHTDGARRDDEARMRRARDQTTVARRYVAHAQRPPQGR